MQNILYSKFKTKNLLWNHDINNVLFYSKQYKQNISPKNFTDAGFTFNFIVKHAKNVNLLSIVKILTLYLKIQNNNTWKLLNETTNLHMHISQLNPNIIFNTYVLNTLILFMKNAEFILLYSRQEIEKTPKFSMVLSKLLDNWLLMPQNMAVNNPIQLNISNVIKQHRKFLTRRTLNSNSLNIELYNSNDINAGGLHIYQREEIKDHILHTQHFNENHFKTPLKYLYLLFKLEQKIEVLLLDSNQSTAIKTLLQFHNYLQYLIQIKQNRYFSEKKILGQNDLLSKIKTIAPEIFFQFLQTKYKKQKNINILWNNTLNIRSASVFGVKTRMNPTRLNAAKFFTGKKLEIRDRYFKRENTSKMLNLLLGAKVQIFYVNALSFAKFGFLLEKQKGNSFLQNLSVNPSKFLNNLDREMISKYKYIGVYIKDLIRVCFIALFLKKPAFLAKFIAFQISVLPKNRRETSFVRFLIKVVKTLAAEREEILGLRLKFKGRVNRWRRTKVISGQRGILPLHTINNRIEYGSAQAINRKGALGIHIWIWYNPLFKNTLKETYTQYFKYSNYLNTQTKY